MALKAIFKTMKNEGYVVKPLEQYLLSLNSKEENDRAIDVNAPSQVSACLRARYYARTSVDKDPNSIDPRQRRIFDNGTHVHLRLQEYLTKQGLLLLDEVPIRNDEYNIQGHTDGFIKISPIEIAILEIKSMKTENFQKLRDAEPGHKQQASVYMFCAEERRKYLQETYTTREDFDKSLKERVKYYESLYQHLEDGNKYTREEKIAHQVELHKRADDILYGTPKPIKKCVILYEDKNDQSLKEFCIEWNDDIIIPILHDFNYLNQCVKEKSIPNRCATSKSDSACRWCNYKIECWN